MSWLLFIDESGHDHRNMPFEVRGGIALHLSRIWPFVQDFFTLEQHCFGTRLIEYGKEIKGSKLLERKHFSWAQQLHELTDAERQKAVRRFLSQGAQEQRPSQRDFTAYGQACLMMADGIFSLLERHRAVVFASLIRQGCRPPRGYQYEHFLRKDHVFLQERFFYFLERNQEYGLFVMDQTEATDDSRFVKRLRNYYTKTRTGRERTRWIVPEPLFVDSRMYPAIQAADLIIYCINWGYRLPAWDYHGQVRDEIGRRYGEQLSNLQFSGDGYRDGNVFRTWGIFYVPDPYEPRQ